VCAVCQYKLTGIPVAVDGRVRCPECGKPYRGPARTSRRAIRALLLGFVLVLMGAGVVGWRWRAELIVRSIPVLPTTALAYLLRYPGPQEAGVLSALSQRLFMDGEYYMMMRVSRPRYPRDIGSLTRQFVRASAEQAIQRRRPDYERADVLRLLLCYGDESNAAGDFAAYCTLLNAGERAPESARVFVECLARLRQSGFDTWPFLIEVAESIASGETDCTFTHEDLLIAILRQWPSDNPAFADREMAICKEIIASRRNLKDADLRDEALLTLGSYGHRAEEWFAEYVHREETLVTGTVVFARYLSVSDGDVSEAFSRLMRRNPRRAIEAGVAAYAKRLYGQDPSSLPLMQLLQCRYSSAQALTCRLVLRSPRGADDAMKQAARETIARCVMRADLWTVRDWGSLVRKGERQVDFDLSWLDRMDWRGIPTSSRRERIDAFMGLEPDAR
jgi:hypothetical protein